MTNWLEEFILERRYLKNVSPKTEQYYRDSWSAFVRYAGTDQLAKKITGQLTKAPRFRSAF